MSHTHAVLLNSLAVLVPSASPLSHPGFVCPLDSMSRDHLHYRRPHAGVTAALAEIPDKSLRLARQILICVLRLDSLRL
jgi:hypothetical protein